MIGSIFGILASKPFVDKNDAWSGFTVAIQGMFAGYVIGNSFGVYTTGNDRYHRGSYVPALLGSIAGSGFGLALYHIDARSHPSALGIWLGPPIGAIIGFNLFNERKNGIKVSFLRPSLEINRMTCQSSERWTSSHVKQVIPICSMTISLDR